jgi:membrane protease YdiL (CAAX protease family)
MKRTADSWIFLVGALLLAAATRIVIPRLVARGWEPLLAWFATGSVVVFFPLIVMGLAVLRSDGGRLSRERLRLGAPLGRDWLLIGAGSLVVFITTGLIATILRHWLGAELAPPFLRVEPLGVHRLWILAVWFPFWLLNVLGEEFVWRAVLLPKQEARWGRAAWLIHAALWGVFHFSFGATVVLLALPCLVVVPFIAQRTRNTWAGVTIHALSNGPPFVLIALGLI